MKLTITMPDKKHYKDWGISTGSTKRSYHKIDTAKLKKAAALIVEALEGDYREGTERTPERVERDWGELFDGYNYEPEDILNRSFDAEGYDEIIMIDTDFISFCEHHILPFWGKAWVGYVPGKRIVGLDKIIKLVWMYSRRLQNQERITVQIADAMERILRPRGVMVVMEAQHGCISYRGTRANSKTKTSVCRGMFRKNINTKNEFLQMMENGHIT